MSVVKIVSTRTTPCADRTGRVAPGARPREVESGEHRLLSQGNTWHQARPRTRTQIGLPTADPGPRRRLIATLPALEVPRPDWPVEAVVVGPLHFEPTTTTLTVPPGDGPVIVVAPSTASTGAAGLARTALAHLIPGRTLPPGSRVVVSRLGGDDIDVPPWAVVGLGGRTNCSRRPIW